MQPSGQRVEPALVEDAPPLGPLTGGRPAARRAWGWSLAGLLSLLAAWPLASLMLGPEIVPGPLATGQFLWREVVRGQFWGHVGITLLRVLLSFALALLLGVPLGWLLGRRPQVAAFLAPWLAVGLTLPRILIMLVAYLLIGLNERALVVAITAILLPTVAVGVREGLRSLDPRLNAMAHAFRVPAGRQLRAVILPQLTPVLLGSARVTLSLSWKMVIFAEVFGRTSGVGYMISFYFQQFEMRGILAYGLIMTLILSAIDFGLAALGDQAFRWRSGL